MLNAISWQQYGTAILLLSLAWYSFIGLRFYRPKLAELLKINPRVESHTPPVTSQPRAVIGAAKPETDTGLFEPEELRFSSVQPDDISSQTLPKGPSDDLLAEAEVLVRAYHDNDDKAGFLSLFQLLLEKYEGFADEISLPAIIKALDTHELPFKINATEWPLTFAA